MEATARSAHLQRRRSGEYEILTISSGRTKIEHDGLRINTQQPHGARDVSSAIMPARITPSYLAFDKAAYPWKPDINYRVRPTRYRVGKGEQGVLICEPYKSELAPHWRFKTPSIAKRSAGTIYKMFVSYLDEDDFVGADMARKFLQMGFTRARRYANYKAGRKYDKEHGYKPKQRGTGDPGKAESAAIFYGYWKRAKSEKRYAARKKEWKGRYG